MAKKSKQHTLKAKVAPAGHPPRELAALLQGERRCPVVHTTDGEVLVLGNAHAREVAEDADLYSSQVSTHLQLPNGLDGEDHARFRGLIERYLEPAVVEKREPEFRDVARDVIAEALPGLRAEVDAVADLGARYAVRAMTTWLGWPRDLEGRLFAWVKENAAATRSGDSARTAAVADEFDRIITTVLGPRLKEGAAHDDVTQQLITDTSLGRRLKKKEIVSVLRNWTGGDVSSMALCIGVILDRLAADTVLQEHLRFGVPDAEFTAIVDELLRLDSPFVSNRRVTTRPASLGEVEMPAGQRVRIHWTAANLDPEAFADPDGYAPEDNAARNLVWGAGPHVCPGKPLSIVEIRAFLSELLATAAVWPGAGEGTRAVHPIGGWERLPVTLEKL